MLRAVDVSFAYDSARPVLNRVSIEIGAGEIVGLTGPSGGGKSTLGRILAGHRQPQRGSVVLDDDGDNASRGRVHPVQYLFQSPETAVDPRWTIEKILTEAWDPDREMRLDFGLSPHWGRSYPHELSGGELQRITILRALAPGVRFLVADEVTAMLDPLTQAQIWRALIEFARQRRVGMLVLSHDLDLLERICDRRLRLCDGRLAEFADDAGMNPAI